MQVLPVMSAASSNGPPVASDRRYLPYWQRRQETGVGYNPIRSTRRLTIPIRLIRYRS